VPYPKKLLNAGEDLYLDLRPHWWYFSKHILTAIPLILLFILVWNVNNSITTWVWVVILVAWIVWLAAKYVQWNYTHFVVTTNRVIFRTGAFAKHGVEIPMDRISNINFHQGIWERIIGAGDLEIESAGRDGQSRFDDVWHPDAVQQEIHRVMGINAQGRAGATPPPPPAAAATVPEQLNQLADLRDRGVITAEEFETKKAQLLDRM
jgi:membrane protein YdbS with pleckstrin-like domain